MYDIFNKKQTIERKIQHIVQIKLITDYVVKFMKHVNFIKWNDAVKWSCSNENSNFMSKKNSCVEEQKLIC